MSQSKDAQRIVDTVLEQWQRIDVLVNNAGITKKSSPQKMTDEDWEQVIAVNLSGTFNTTSAALPAMINQRFGRIINISSVVGTNRGSRSGELLRQLRRHHCFHQDSRP